MTCSLALSDPIALYPKQPVSWNKTDAVNCAAQQDHEMHAHAPIHDPTSMVLTELLPLAVGQRAPIPSS